jgi:hypothetical protein
VYSSLNAVEALAPEGSAYAGLLGFTLFGMWGPHDWLILNPGSRYQLLASPEELSAVVSGADVRVDIVR